MRHRASPEASSRQVTTQQPCVDWHGCESEVLGGLEEDWPLCPRKGIISKGDSGLLGFLQYFSHNHVQLLPQRRLCLTLQEKSSLIHDRKSTEFREDKVVLDPGSPLGKCSDQLRP